MRGERADGDGGGERRCVLVTGAAGVVGSAVVEALAGHDVVCLRRRGSPPAHEHEVEGTLSEPRLGLGDAAYADLRARVDCVVHCAATSNYASREAEVRAVNVDGTARVLELCAGAGAALVHVGTAFDPHHPDPPGPGDPPESPFSREPYLRSKRDAQALVAASGLRATVVRPSLVIGDRESGATPRFQGIHTLMRFLLTETYGVVPADPADRADMLPRDTVAQAIACLVAADEPPAVCWLTAGERAPTMQRVVDVALDYAHEVGLDPPAPRFMDADVIDRLVRPALIPELPHRERQRFEYVIEYSLALRTGVVQSSLDDFAGRIDVPDAGAIERALLSSLRFWGAATDISAAGTRR